MLDKAFYKREHDAICAWYRDKYAKRDSYLIFDGVADPENYAGIMFLLKEAYGKEQKRDEYDLVKDLAEKGPWGHWGHVAKWTYGLLHTNEHTIAPYRDISWEEKNAMLRKIAVVNVKKVDGKKSSDHDELMTYARDNAEILRREIAHTQPRIIVCGKTFDFLKEIYGLAGKYSCDNWYYWLELDGVGAVLVLDYYHFAAQYPELLTYYGLTNIYQQALLHKQDTTEQASESLPFPADSLIYI